LNASYAGSFVIRSNVVVGMCAYSHRRLWCSFDCQLGRDCGVRNCFWCWFKGFTKWRLWAFYLFHGRLFDLTCWCLKNISN
jgi:hypothetical protein